MKKYIQYSMFHSVLFIILLQYAMANEPSIYQTVTINPQMRGVTHHMIDEKGLAVVGDAPPYHPQLKQEQQSLQKLCTIGTSLFKTNELDMYIPAGEFFAVQFDQQSRTLNFIYPDIDNPFSETVQAAIYKAPAWMENDLKNVFSFLDPTNQEKWATAILDATDPYVDEIAFCIAHLSPQYLMSSYASVQLLKDNAKLIYENDQFLKYVEVIDYGSSKSDPNYYSTTKYRKVKISDTIEVEVPRSIYYWYIVHPKISDEIPAYIDPDVVENNNNHNNNITTPEKGYFWRDFLFNYNDPDYAKLKDLLLDCKIIWDQFGQSSSVGAHALEILNRWHHRSMEFTSNQERPHQPVRIYRKHIGRCGEDSDMRVAIARSALIPATGVASYSTDHVWNEFWDERWIHWDGVIDDPYMYVDSWGKEFGSVFKWRGDGTLTSVTARYTKEYSKLHIYALDSLNNPIDGARVILYTTGLDGSLWFDNYSTTDNEGKVTFIVGTDRKYYARMQCDYGSVPEGSENLFRVVSNSQAGKEYSVSMSVAAEKPVKSWQEIPTPTFQGNRYYLEVDFAMPSQIIRGTDLFDDLETNAYQFNKKAGGRTNFFIVDETNYQNLIGDKGFKGFYCLCQCDSASIGFEFDEQSDWYCIFDNTNSLHTLQHIVGTVNLYSAFDPEIPKVYIVQNYPNPMNPQKDGTIITYQLPQKTKVEISIYNVLGQKVKTLVNETKYAGEFSVVWDGRDDFTNLVSSGVYACNIKTDEGMVSQKMVVIR